MKVQRLNEEMFAPMEQNEMMVVFGGRSKVHDLVIETYQTEGGGTDTHIRSVKSKD